MARDLLLFDGHRFKSARIDIDRTVMANGTGQAWEARRPQGFWRAFSELNLGNDADVLMFLARYGDVNGALPKRSALESWQPVQDRLKTAALAYDAPDGSGISHVSKDSPRIKHAMTLGLPGDSPPEFPATLEPGNNGLVGRVSDLGAYMQASAIIMIGMRMPMRRCAECGHWYALETARAIYCSASCKIAASRARQKGAA